MTNTPTNSGATVPTQDADVVLGNWALASSAESGGLTIPYRAADADDETDDDADADDEDDEETDDDDEEFEDDELDDDEEEEEEEDAEKTGA